MTTTTTSDSPSTVGAGRDRLRTPETAVAGPVCPTTGQDAPDAPTAVSGPSRAVSRGRANSAKGKRAERSLVTWLRTHGHPGAERTIRTGHRVPGRVSADRGDIDGTPGICWQVKDVDDRALWQVSEWLDATERQRQAAGADVGALVVKRRGQADPGAWWAYVPLGVLAPTVPANLAALPVRLAVADLVAVLGRYGYGDQSGGQLGDDGSAT